ncbi:radical SAM family heme chaperone HemW [Bengtsoniella intestinalis]|uniref:radical SAM family heme chaperone HemW n=1 Tax=Bengtsoniella intestinalis TaxID=3073143 RepID=UPI00391F08D6
MKSTHPTPMLGLYIHIPFCKRKCDYCDFYSVAEDGALMDRYITALCAHLKETAPFAKHHVVDTVYVGGGTPTLLGAKRLVVVLKTVQKYYALSKDVEITIEANPDSAQDFRMLRSLRRAGCNRISLGMQSAHDSELEAVGRIHTMAQVTTAVEAIRKAKIKNLSLDLIYGLPNQTPDQWQQSLAAAVALKPQHLSCYGLKLEENTPLFNRRDTLTLPDEEVQAKLYLDTVSYLAAAGYGQYEISNFAQESHRSRHNMKYWTLGEYAGFGPSAHSDFGDVRYGYVRDIEGYIQGVLGDGDFVSETTHLTESDRDTEYLMLGLRTVEGIDGKVFERRFRRNFNCFLPFLTQCNEAGYVVEDQGRWYLTPQGFLVSNQIIGGLLDVLSEDKLRRADAKARGDYRIIP